MQVGRHEDEAGVGSGLEVGEEGEGEEELREVVYLEVGVEVVGCEVEFSDAFAGVEDELDRKMCVNIFAEYPQGMEYAALTASICCSFFNSCATSFVRLRSLRSHWIQ